MVYFICNDVFKYLYKCCIASNLLKNKHVPLNQKYIFYKRERFHLKDIKRQNVILL